MWEGVTLEIERVYKNAVPAEWTLSRPDRRSLHYRACAFISAVSYATWRLRPEFQKGSSLPGWLATRSAHFDIQTLRSLLTAETDLEEEKKEDKRPKVDKRIDSILEVTEKLGYPPKQIPRGGKSAVKQECLKDRHLFTDSTFDQAWKKASTERLIQVKDVDKFRRRW
jgi:hypothetical protein